MKKTDVKDAGATALEKLKPALLALQDDQIVQPNAGLQPAAMAALVLVDRARHADFATRAALLPADIFDKRTVDKLEEAALAAQHIEVESAREDAAATGVKVDVAIVDEATGLREKMLKTAEYMIGDQEAVARELADIRLGTGYLDLANDLTRLALVYGAHRTALAADTKHYSHLDASRATALAAGIRDAYRAAASRAGEFSELRPRVFTELSRLYNEVRAAAQFFFRADAAQLDGFPPLRVAARAVGPARRAKKASDDAATSPTPPSPVVSPTGGTTTPATNGGTGSAGSS